MKIQSDRNQYPCSRTSDLCPTHLIFLRELQIVVGLEELCVLGQLGDGDGRVIHHTCSSNKNKKDPPRGGKGRESVSKAENKLKSTDNWGFAANITMDLKLSA